MFMIKRTIVFIIKTDTHDDKTDLKFTDLFSFLLGRRTAPTISVPLRRRGYTYAFPVAIGRCRVDATELSKLTV